MQTSWHKSCTIKNVFEKEILHDKSCEDKKKCDLYGKVVKNKEDTNLYISCKS